MAPPTAGQITDLLCAVDNLCFDALHIKYRGYRATNQYRYEERGIARFKVALSCCRDYTLGDPTRSEGVYDDKR